MLRNHSSTGQRLTRRISRAANNDWRAFAIGPRVARDVYRSMSTETNRIVFIVRFVLVTETMQAFVISFSNRSVSEGPYRITLHAH